MRNFGIQLVLYSTLLVTPFVLGKWDHDHGDYIDLMPAYSVRMGAGGKWDLKNQYSKSQYFVEGFEMISDTQLIQSAGLYSGSEIQIMNIDHNKKTTEVARKATLNQQFFGEGCTAFNGFIYQMTYREGKVFKFNLETLKEEGTFDMPEEMIEGWGLTHDTDHLYASDGTEYIYVIDPNTFTVISQIEVYDPSEKKNVEYINELEYVDGFIYANVLPLNIIIKVDVKNGHVVNKYNLTKLKSVQTEKIKNTYWDSFNNVMNGIAYRKATNTFLVTGKNYDYVFEVQFK
eukprot:403372005